MASKHKILTYLQSLKCEKCELYSGMQEKLFCSMMTMQYNQKAKITNKAKAKK